MHGSNFITRQSETVMVWHYKNADCSFVKWIYCVIYYNVRDTFVPRAPFATRNKHTANNVLWSGLRVRLRYDTIRDAILTCARKPTWIGLIYRTETTTKNCITEKPKSKSRYVRSNSKSPGNHVVSSEKKKKKKGCTAVGRIWRKRY